MTLTIEDGTDVTGADSFITVSECSTFAENWFGAALAGSTANKEAALRRAFGYMRSLDWADPDDWPTFGGEIPDAVKDAQAIFARVEFQTTNALQPSVTAGTQKILVGVDSLRWQATGAAGVDAQRSTVTMALDRLKGLILDGGASRTLMRG